MPQRTEIVTLNETDRATLATALKKDPVEQILSDLRQTLNEGLDQVRALAKATTVQHDQAVHARAALQQRIDRIHTLPTDLVAADLQQAAVQPLQQHGVQLCDEILTEFENEPRAPQTAAAHSPS